MYPLRKYLGGAASPKSMNEAGSGFVIHFERN